MPRPPKLPFPWLLALLALLATAGCAAEVSTRVTGDAAGPNCSVVSVAITKTKLRYPFLGSLGSLGWGRGVPSASRSTAELFIYLRSARSLRQLVKITAPREWDDYTRFSMTPRILPDATILFALAGCPKSNQNCADQRYFRVENNGKYTQISAWPEATPQESANLKQCTTYRLYPESSTDIAIGPTGGPWKPVLSFANGRLSVIER